MYNMTINQMQEFCKNCPDTKLLLNFPNDFSAGDFL